MNRYSLIWQIITIIGLGLIFTLLTFHLPYRQVLEHKPNNDEEKLTIENTRFFNYIDLVYFKECLEQIDGRIETKITTNKLEIDFKEINPQRVESILFNHRPIHSVIDMDLFSSIEIGIEENITLNIRIHRINNKHYLYLPNEMIYSFIKAL
jgi:hypothetical protein